MKKIIICAAAVLGLAAASPLTALGAEAKGWQTDEKGRIFYYGDDGETVSGTVTIDGVPYYFAENGVLKTGWRTVDGKRRYYDHETGKPIYGWMEYCGRKYCLTPDEGKLSGMTAEAEDGGYVLIGEDGSVITEKGFAKQDDKFY